jgi:hypothetical protein
MMADIEYFRGLPEVGIVPRAPHAGPLLQHVYEQEHDRGGFAGAVTHTYYCETIGFHSGSFFSSGGSSQLGMVTVHPVGLPHGPKPAALRSFLDGPRPAVHNEVGIMADFANPARISSFALGLSRPKYMDAWSAYTSDPTFAYRRDRADEIRHHAERLADARDELRLRSE